MPTETLQKMGEVQLTPIEGAQLLKLDPSIPYVIVVPKNTHAGQIEKTLAFLGANNVCATLIAGDPKDFQVFASVPWNVRSQPFPEEKFCEGHPAEIAAPATKKRAPRKATTKKPKKDKSVQ